MIGIIDVGGVVVQMLSEGDAIMRMTANGKQWEPQTRAIWQTLVKAGEGVIDVGAYTGVYAIASALLGASVTAIEPHPRNYERLCNNAKINSVSITTLEAAASDCCGRVALNMKQPHRLSDTASLVDPWDWSVPVRAVRIDDLKLQSRAGLIKIDVERHETSVLAGTRRTIMEHRPLVIVECLGAQAACAVDAVMGGMGYVVSDVFDDRNRLYDPK